MSRRPSRIHQGLVGERALVGTPYLADQALRKQYDAEIAPRTTAALGRVLREVAAEHAGVRRALDLGAGTGAAGAAVRAHFGDGVELVAVDRVAGPGISVVADLRKPGRPRGVIGRFDLVVEAHVLNELGDLAADARAALVLGWCEELLEEHGTCILVEPALRETSRALLDVRDRVLRAGLQIVAPCCFAGPCPALERPRDWCHDTARQPGKRVDFSYLVLRRGPRATATDPPGGKLFRIVSDRIEEKGRSRLFGCGPSGRHALVRQDRDANEPNAAWDTIERGDVVVVGETREAGDGLRVAPTTTITKR